MIAQTVTATETRPQIGAADSSLHEDLRLAADCDAPVLISSDSIAGAERLALWIHRTGPRRHGPFVVLDAALRALQAALFDSIREVTTATAEDAGNLILKARGGTLFIPHLEEMSSAMQVALLHFLEQPEMRSHASVRLIAATHPLAFERVQAGRLREELYYRINVIQITV